MTTMDLDWITRMVLLGAGCFWLGMLWERLGAEALRVHRRRRQAPSA